MIIVSHRINTIEALLNTSKQFGCEIDVRNHGDELIVIHDPFVQEGLRLQEFLQYYRHKFLIVNVKEEGLGSRIRQLLDKSNIKKFFILDESVPFIIKHAKAGEPEFAIRVSEFESFQGAIKLQRMLKILGKSLSWVWVDTFTGEVLSKNATKQLQAAKLRCCFVSPELHKIESPKKWKTLIEDFSIILKENGIIPDMICTKEPEFWLSLYSKTRR